MKKLITLTSILAAGTLAANATTTIDLLDFENGTVTAASSNLSIGTEFTATSLKSLTKLEWNWVWENASLANQVKANVDDETLNLQMGASGSVSGGNYIGIWFDTENAVSSLAYTIEYQSVWGNTKPSSGDYSFSGTLYGVKGTTVTTLDSSKATYGTDFSSASTTVSTTLSVSDTSEEYDYYAVIFHGIKESSSSSGGVGTLVKSVKATVIPEPSMFGLLAGTLALGLAGTRRRRAK